MSSIPTKPMGLSLVLGLAAIAVVVVLAGDAFAAQPNAATAAASLVARLRAESKSGAAFGASGVVSRNGRLWLAVGSSPGGAPYMGGGPEPTQVRVFHWRAGAWSLSATVTGKLGPSQWIYPESFTGSRDPDFAIEGCGAGDTNCLSVVSDVGGRWHAVPFEYGYGTTLEVNGSPAGHLVQTEVDACGCAGGPSTWTDERYQDGVFEPVFARGENPACSPSALTTVADIWEVQVLHFDRVACAGGWALAVGTGSGFTGPAVALFDTGYHQHHWQVLTLDNGTALPAAPSIYDLPLPLLLRLASGLGPALAPELAAAKLIARLLPRYHFYWPEQEGIVAAGRTEWLIAPIPAGPAPNDYSPYPAAALIYRWNGRSWVVAGRVGHLPPAMNVEWFGGWFVAEPTSDPSVVAFGLAGSDSGTYRVITNAGGTWHVAATR